MTLDDAHVFHTTHPNPKKSYEEDEAEKVHIEFVGHKQYIERDEQTGQGYSNQYGGYVTRIIETKEELDRKTKLRTPAEIKKNIAKMKKTYNARVSDSLRFVKKVSYQVKKVNDNIGLGVFARSDIPAGVVIIPYRGRRIKERVANTLSDTLNQYLVGNVEIKNGKAVVDETVNVDGNYKIKNNRCTIASLVNDMDYRPGITAQEYKEGEKENVALVPNFTDRLKNDASLYFESIREIKKGEQLSMKYGVEYWKLGRNNDQKDNQPEFEEVENPIQHGDVEVEMEPDSPERIRTPRTPDETPPPSPLRTPDLTPPRTPRSPDPSPPPSPGRDEEEQDRRADRALRTRRFTYFDEQDEKEKEKENVRNNVYYERKLGEGNRRKRGPNRKRMIECNIGEYRAARYKCDKRRVKQANGSYKIVNVNCGVKRVLVRGHQGRRENCKVGNRV